MKWTPKPYMKRSVRLVLQHPGFGLLLDPGLGKTSIILAAFDVLRSKSKHIRKVLVIAPLRVCKLVWPAEATKWDEFQHLRVVVLHGPKKDARLAEDADVYVINPEGLPWLVDALKRKTFPFQMLVVDESTKFKHTRTKRFKTLKKMLGKFERRYILTGTPAPNGLLDLFGQLYILDYGEALGEYITHYRERYFYQTGFGGYKWKLLPGRDEEIYARIAPVTLRLDAADYLKLPPLIKTDVKVDLPPKARAAYDELEREFILDLKQGRVTAVNAGSKIGKLRQLAGGAVYLDDDDVRRTITAKRSWGTVHDAKLDALDELIDELSGQPTLVSFEFKHEKARILERLGDIPVIDGALTSEKKLYAIEAAWNAGEIPTLLVHPQAAAHGLNLQKTGRAVVFYSLPWDLELYEQLIRRIWRQGLKLPAFAYHLIASSTVDVLIRRVLNEKRHTQLRLFNALKKEFLK